MPKITNVHYLQKTVTNFSTPVAITIDAVTTAPTKGTIIKDEIAWYRDGKFAVVRLEYNHSTAGSAGSGFYLFSLPGGLQADLTVITASTLTGTTTQWNPGLVESSFSGHAAAANGLVGMAVMVNSTQFKIVGTFGGATNTAIGSAQNGFGTANNYLSGWMRVPIQGWTENN